MADAPDPVGAFAPPARDPTAESSVRDVLALGLERAWRLLVGPGALFVLAWLDRADPWLALGAAVAGLALWLPTSLMLARVVLFPSPPDPGLLDTFDQPASARDLRAVVRAHAAEHVLGALLLVLLLGYVRRLFDPRLALPILAVGALAAAWRATQAMVRLAVREAEIDLAASGRERSPALLDALAAWRVPGLGDRAWTVLARARFRSGDVPGALRALERARRSWRLLGLRAQMGVAVLDRAELDELRAALPDTPAGRSVAVVVDALRRLHEGRSLDRTVIERLRALPEGEPRRLGLLLLAADLAARDPDAARGLLREGGFRPERLPALGRGWPAVARALAPLVAEGPAAGPAR